MIVFLTIVHQSGIRIVRIGIRSSYDMEIFVVFSILISLNFYFLTTCFIIFVEYNQQHFP